MQPWNLGRYQRVSDLVESTSPGSAEHLQQLVRANVPLEIARHVMRSSDKDGAHREIDSGR